MVKKSGGSLESSMEASILSVKSFLGYCGDSENIMDINSDRIKQYAVDINKTKDITYVGQEIVRVKLFYNFLYFKKQIQKNPFDEIDIIDICKLGD